MLMDERSTDEKPEGASWLGAPTATKDVPALDAIQSALYGAARFAERYLEAAGVAGARLTRVICTPDARLWTLAFGEHFFEVHVLDDGVSVRLLQPSVAV